MNIICFHNPDEENGYLSNWYPSQFIVNEIQFFSMEQYMMYKKAVCFKDNDIAEGILGSTDVIKIKALGRMVKNYNDSYWSGIRQIVVYEGLLAKFTQNEELKRRLIETGDNVLAECAVRDRIWGIGLSMQDSRRFEPDQWRGRNLLGYTLMMVRESL